MAPGWRCVTFTGARGAAVDGQVALSLWQTPALVRGGKSAPSSLLATASPEGQRLVSTPYSSCRDANELLTSPPAATGPMRASTNHTRL